MSIEFPPNPTPGDQYSANNGVIYTYNGTVWVGENPIETTTNSGFAWVVFDGTASVANRIINSHNVMNVIRINTGRYMLVMNPDVFSTGNYVVSAVASGSNHFVALGGTNSTTDQTPANTPTFCFIQVTDTSNNNNYVDVARIHVNLNERSIYTVAGGGGGGGGGGSAAAWVNFDGDATTTTSGKCAVRGSYNVSSVDYVGPGIYQINFTTALTSLNYAVNVSAGVPVNGAGSASNIVTAVRADLGLNPNFVYVSTGTAQAPTQDAKYVLVTVNEAATQPAVRAWINFDGSGPIANIRGSSNIGSVSKVFTTGAGGCRWQITFTNPLPNNNYAVVLGGTNVVYNNGQYVNSVGLNWEQNNNNVYNQSTTGFEVVYGTNDQTLPNMGSQISAVVIY